MSEINLLRCGIEYRGSINKGDIRNGRADSTASKVGIGEKRTDTRAARINGHIRGAASGAAANDCGWRPVVAIVTLLIVPVPVVRICPPQFNAADSRLVCRSRNELNRDNTVLIRFHSEPFRNGFAHCPSGREDIEVGQHLLAIHNHIEETFPRCSEGVLREVQTQGINRSRIEVGNGPVTRAPVFGLVDALWRRSCHPGSINCHSVVGVRKPAGREGIRSEILDRITAGVDGDARPISERPGRC